MKECEFIYELTTDCNFNCPYCSIKKMSDANIRYAPLDVSLRICDFFNDVALNTDDVSHVDITLFGGEPTINPYIKDIVKRLHDYNNKKLRYSIYTNMSADIDLYRYLLDNDCTIISTYHMHHITLEEYKYKLEQLLMEYKSNYFTSSFVIGENRLSEKEIYSKFQDFIDKYDNFALLLLPLMDNGNVYKIKTEEIEIKEIKVDYNSPVQFQDQVNHRKNKKMMISDCPNFIKFNGDLCRCSQIQNMKLLNVSKPNAYTTYKSMRKLKFKCNEKLCCYAYND